MKSNTTTILVAAGALLVGGVATAAFMNNRGKSDDVVAPSAEVRPTLDNSLAADDAASSAVKGGGVLEYADVVKVDPVTSKEKVYATVIGTEPVRETSTTSTPREVCNDVVVQEHVPRKDPNNIAGTAAGALIGGVLGNQVGGGDGRKLATVAGAVGGAFAGRAIQQRHADNNVVSRTERQCHTENATSESSRVVGYNVTYRNADGTTGTMRMDSKPGSRIAMGNADNVVGYDVTYRYNGQEKTVRMNSKPASDRLPVIDGQLVTQTAALESAPANQQ
ncbi:MULTISPECIES: glycine zipper 2TM domain-containing protein [Gammaproteobacteria]|jgi:uncharacterized protein YcfJ|uniref:Membrane protein n=1 Tax=Xanthomonas boreopolis TaxID=86183 RepID=A0A919F5Z7_9XANT|nr:glycine zipper 2TM domain-containing protein [Pseudomonas sp. Hp2]GHH49148.1 membrane protein [[Pseudomonas] boreopolis]